MSAIGEIVDFQTLEKEGWTAAQSTLLPSHHKYNYWVKRVSEVYLQLLISNTKFEPRVYQIEHAALYCMRRYNICNGEMGVGKTIISGLAIAAIFKDQGFERPGQIHIAVTSRDAALTRWLVDLNCIDFLKGKVEFIDSEKKLLTSSAPVWIYTHDFPKNSAPHCPKEKHPFISQLMLRSGRHPSFLIIDEINNISIGTKRHKHIQHLALKAKRKLGLTGTLSDGRMGKIHTALRLIYKGRIQANQKGFVHYFNNRKKVNTNYLKGEADVEIKTQTRYLPGLSIARIPEYSALASKFIHRTKLSDPDIKPVCTVPEPNFIEELIDLSDTHQNLYSQVVFQLHPQIKKLIDYSNGKNKLEAMHLAHKLMRASSAPWEFNSLIVCEKLKRLMEIFIECKAKGEKVVVFTNMVSVGGVIENCARTLIGEDCVERIYATDQSATPKNLSKIERTNRLERVMYSKKSCAGVFNIKLTNNSIDLTEVGTLVFWDIPWESIWVQQAIKRCVRPGSIHKKIDIHFLINKGTIDAHQYNLLIQKSRSTDVIQDFDVSQVMESSIGRINAFDVISKINEDI